MQKLTFTVSFALTANIESKICLQIAISNLKGPCLDFKTWYYSSKKDIGSSKIWACKKWKIKAVRCITNDCISRWSELWLKEGFASFMEYQSCGKLYPELKTDVDYLSDISASAFYLDSLRSSHAIEVEIEDPNELSSIYDSITYEKSNACMNMLFHYLGEEKFRTGLRLYIKRLENASFILRFFHKFRKNN